MVIVVGLAMVLVCVVLARMARRGSTLRAVCTTLGVWLAVLLVLYVLGVAL